VKLHDIPSRGFLSRQVRAARGLPISLSVRAIIFLPRLVLHVDAEDGEADNTTLRHNYGFPEKKSIAGLSNKREEDVGQSNGRHRYVVD
jgi:hypothetical protein